MFTGSRLRIVRANEFSFMQVEVVDIRTRLGRRKCEMIAGVREICVALLHARKDWQGDPPGGIESINSITDERRARRGSF